MKHTQQNFNDAIAMLQELLEHGLTSYPNAEDSCGYCSICGVIEYKQCEPFCAKRKGKEFLERLRKEGIIK